MTEEELPPGWLVDFRFVYEEKEPENQAQRHYAELARVNYPEFLKQYRAAEREYQKMKETGVSATVEEEKLEPDEASEEIREMCRKWLEERLK